MNTKIINLEKQNTWNLVKSSFDAHIINNKWVYKIKLNNDNIINKFKVKYIAKGFKQIYNINFAETFSTIVQSMIYRLLISLINNFILKLKQ